MADAANGDGPAAAGVATLPLSDLGTHLLPWVLATLLLVTDQVTKQFVLAGIAPHELVPVAHPYLYFTHTRNPGIAFGLHLGGWSRPIFVAAALAVLLLLISIYRSTRPTERARRYAIAMLCAGAVGNLIDRIRWEEGVVDFVRLTVAGYDWPIFNVADISVTLGAVLLGLSLLADARPRRAF